MPAIVAGAALLLAGCGEDAARVCRQSGTAELCLAGGPQSYRFEAEGFAPNSEATVSTGGADPPVVIRMDAGGRVQKGALAGVLGGPAAQDLVVTGSDAGGGAAEFTFIVPAVRP